VLWDDGLAGDEGWLLYAFGAMERGSIKAAVVYFEPIPERFSLSLLSRSFSYPSRWGLG